MSPQGNKIQDEPLFGDSFLDFSHYWKIIRRHLWRIILLAFIITASVAVFVMSLTPVYQATSSLLIEVDEAKVVSIEEIYGLDSSKKEYFQTQYEILKSRQVAEKVVEKLDLINHPLYNKDDSSWLKDLSSNITSTIKQALSSSPKQKIKKKSEEEKLLAKKRSVARRVLAALTITPVKGTQVVDITFESESASLAAEVANTIAETYIENYLDSKFNMTSKATAWLNDSLLGLKAKLDESEQKLADFYEANKLVNLDGVAGLTSDELQLLSTELSKTKTNLKQSEIIFEQVKLYRGNINELAKIPEVLNHASIQNVKRAELEAESKVSELSKVYGPKHQKMISALGELESVRESLNKQIEALVSGISKENEQLKSRVNRLQASVDESKEEFRKLNMLDSQRRILQREVDINQQLYNSFFTRLKETNEVGGFETANARILDEALPPSLPFKPRTSMFIMLAFVTSLGLGVFIVISLDLFNNGICGADDVERKLGQRMVGQIPWQPHKKKEDLPLRQYFNSKHYSFTEAIRTVRTSLQLQNIDKATKVIMVTSSVPKEGKTTLSINLAFAMSQVGRTLLVEADLRRPTIAKQFGFPGFQPGLVNLISGTHSLEECVVSDVDSGIDVICSGSIPPDPQEFLASDAFKQFMLTMRDKYDYIVVDTAPTQAVIDAIVVSKSCDELLYVVKADSTSDKLINSCLKRFIKVGQRVGGIVLNQVDEKKASLDRDQAGFYDNRYGYHKDTRNKADS